MKLNYPYLKDSIFLKIIDELSIKTQYVRLTVLNKKEEPIDTIEGKATGGNISVNGTSSIRRTGSLSMVADESNYKITELENLIYMNKRVCVEVGFDNNTSLWTQYETIWFPLGIFIMAGANIQKNNSGINISLTLKDKMCLLNGECGGTFEAAITHSPIYVEEIKDNENYGTEYPLLYTLIYELVSEWGGIDPSQIIISDVPLDVKNIVRWVGANEVYMAPTTVDNKYTYYNMSFTEINGAVKYDYNDSIGYELLDFTYPTEKELTSSPGESITSVLDKIKAVLGNYEYFFDINGNFIFQKIKNYEDKGIGYNDLNQAINKKALDYLVNRRESVYDFANSQIITSYSNAPNWTNVKNDFVVWGEADNDNKSIIRYHLILDYIPKWDDSKKQDDFYLYHDLAGVQRAAYGQASLNSKLDYVIAVCDENPDSEAYQETRARAVREKANDTPIDMTNIASADWRIQAYYMSLINDVEYFYSKEIVQELPKTVDISKIGEGEITFLPEASMDTITYYIDVLENPTLKKFYVSEIGKRTKSISDEKINCLFDTLVPEVFFIEVGANAADQRNELVGKGITNFYQVPPSVFNSLAVGSARNSAYELLRAQLHTLLSFNETVSIGVIPIYHLEPNTRITIEDKDTNISGGYMIKSFNLPLDINGTMTIQCAKAIERI